MESQKTLEIWAQGFSELIQTFPFVNFRFLEGRLRNLNSSVYLIAAPVSSAPQETCSRALFFPEGDLPYYLYISFNGKEEADGLRLRLGITSYEENLQNLMNTGF